MATTPRFCAGLVVLLALAVLVACGSATSPPPEGPGATATLPAAGGGITPIAPTDTPAPPSSALPATAAPAVPPTPELRTTGPIAASSPLVPANPPVSTPRYAPVSDADRAWIGRAITDTIALRSYHFTQSLDAGAEGSYAVEGDYLAPDRVHDTGTVLGTSREVLILGNRTYRKPAGGVWAVTATTGAINPAANLTENQSWLRYAADWVAAGHETLDGVPVDHFIAPLNADVVAYALGSFDLWRDTRTGHLYRATVALDPRSGLATIAAVATAFPNQGVPALPVAAPYFFTMTITQPNDPSITLPTPPAVAP